MIRFDATVNVPPLQGILLYVRSEHSIDFELDVRVERTSTTRLESNASLAAGTLQLEVAVDTNLLLYPWGYLPSDRWIRRRLPHVTTRSARVRCIADVPLVAGVSTDLEALREWTACYDVVTGWLCVVEHFPALDGIEVFEFATSAAVSLDGDRLTGLWMKPTIIQDR
jgi:hypothetical protein